jgi:hypothetical protein
MAKIFGRWKLGVRLLHWFPRGVRKQGEHGWVGIMSVSVELPRLDEGKFEGALFRGEEG